MPIKTSKKITLTLVLMATAVAATTIVRAQTPTPPAPAAQTPAPAGRGAAPAGRGGFTAYPQRPPGDPAAIERGKTLYGLNCALCHAPDARGAVGPSLIRSEIMLKDQKGELLLEVVRAGRPDRGMPPLAHLTPANVSDISAYVHNFPVGSRDPARMRPTTIVVGDAKAGVGVFAKKCATCHSATGDLKGLGARFEDPRQLQQWWLMPQNAGRGAAPPPNLKPVTVSVVFPSGEKVEGRLRRIDDFIVSLYLENGQERTIRRNGDVPKVELRDPLQPHRDMLPAYTDKEIHDLTAYLVTVK